MIAAFRSARPNARTAETQIQVIEQSARLTRVAAGVRSLDVRAASRWSRELTALAAPGRTVAVDMASVDILDSAGLGAIVGAVKSLRADGADLVLHSVTAEVRVLLELVRLHQLLDVYNDAAEVIRTLDGEPRR